MYTSFLVCGVILAHCSSESIAQTFLGVFGATQSIDKCGRSRAATISPLIINGTNAPVGTYPWHAGLYYRTEINQKETWEQQCGGSLITAQFILTAAHCVYNRSAADVRVALGKYFRSWNNYALGEQRRNVSRITNHNDFDTTTFNFDVALLLLDEEIVLGELIMPVCTGNLGTSNYILNKKLYIVGWGQTMNVRGGSSSETLLYNDVMFIPSRVCKHLIPSGLNLFDKFCTMKNSSDESVAQAGDSGGGLTVLYEGLHYILGIVSSKIDYNEKSTTFFTNVTWPYHLLWIETEIRKYDSTFRWSTTKHSSRPHNETYIPPHTDERIVSKPQSEERKSVQMCKKYAKSVYSTVPKPKGRGEEKTDTCALVEPIGAPVPVGSHDIPELPVNAEPREFPHIAVIGYGNKTHTRPSIRCVGNLISERYVLSVATCSTTPVGPAAWVRLGDYNVNSNKDDDESDSRSVIYDIVQLIDHPDYRRSDDPNDIEYHDIALYRLNASVQFTEYIRPICLHGGDRFAKTFALITGWGPVELGREVGLVSLRIYRNRLPSTYFSRHERGEGKCYPTPDYTQPTIEGIKRLLLNAIMTVTTTTIIPSLPYRGRPNDILQKANLTIVEDKECSEAYNFNGDVVGGIDAALAVCAALMDGRDTCMSLTGSPLQLRLQDPYCMYSLAGVAFFNRPCFVKSPGVYTRVSHYLEWIESEVWP